jgi:hypothetical protein
VAVLAQLRRAVSDWAFPVSQFDILKSIKVVAVLARFVLSREVLIWITKIGRACRSVPFNTDPWSRVRDQFGDQNVLLTFAIAMVSVRRPPRAPPKTPAGPLAAPTQPERE